VTDIVTVNEENEEQQLNEALNDEDKTLEN
jgi:hypothetical protein